MPKSKEPRWRILIIVSVLLVQTIANLIFRERDKNKRVNRRLTMQASGMDRDAIYSTLVRNPSSIGRQVSSTIANVASPLSSTKRSSRGW